MPFPDLRLLRYFVAVADERNFTRAAERLNMAQPPLSAAIKKLEGRLGVRLLDRTSRTVELTPAGAALHERGRVLLAEAEALAGAVRAVEREPAGLLRVGFSPAARWGLWPDLLAGWARDVPAVMVHSREDATGVLLGELRGGRLDLAVTFCAEPHPEIEIRPLHDEQVVLHVRDDHPLAGRREVALAELAAETLIVAGGPDSPGFTSMVIALCEKAGFTPTTLADPYPDLGVQAVREALGVVVYVPSAFDGTPEGGRLIPIRDDATLPFALAWRRNSRSAAAAALAASALETVRARG